MSSEHTPVLVHGDEEVTDRGLFGLGEKKDEKKEEEAIVTGVQKLHIEEAEQKKHGLVFDKLHRSGSSSSSSSNEEEEIGEDGEKKKKKKKGLKEKVEEKLHGEKKEEREVKLDDQDWDIVLEKVEETVEVPAQEEEKKGFLEKIKEKLPGYHKSSGEDQSDKSPTSH